MALGSLMLFDFATDGVPLENVIPVLVQRFGIPGSVETIYVKQGASLALYRFAGYEFPRAYRRVVNLPGKGTTIVDIEQEKANDT